MTSCEDGLNVGLINGLWDRMGVSWSKEWKICSVTRVSPTWMDVVWFYREYEREEQHPSRPLSEVISDGRFVEALALVEELSDVVTGILQQVVLDHELDPLWQRRGRDGAGMGLWVRSCSWKTKSEVLSPTFLGSMLNFFRPMFTCLFLCIFFLELQENLNCISSLIHQG